MESYFQPNTATPERIGKIIGDATAAVIVLCVIVLIFYTFFLR